MKKLLPIRNGILDLNYSWLGLLSLGKGESMKTACPVCGKEGLLQVRGNSERVQHYVGSKDSKRVYLYHKVGRMEIKVWKWKGLICDSLVNMD